LDRTVRALTFQNMIFRELMEEEQEVERTPIDLTPPTPPAPPTPLTSPTPQRPEHQQIEENLDQVEMA